MTNGREHEDGESLALSPRDAARALGISPRTLWEHTRRGKIPHVRLGRRILYPTRELREWLGGQRQRGQRPAETTA